MITLRWIGMLTVTAGLALASLQACSDDDGDSGDDDDDASVSSSSSSGHTGASSGGASSGGASSSSGGASSGAASSSGGSSSGGASSGGASSSGGSSSGGDAGTDTCGDIDFGAPVVPFAEHDIEAFAGGPITPGTYDAVRAEIGSATEGAVRETVTFTADGHFLRIRQVTILAPGPVTVRTGTFTTNGNSITFAAECQTKDGVTDEPEDQTTPYDFVADGGVPAFRYGAAGVRFTLEQH